MNDRTLQILVIGLLVALLLPAVAATGDGSFNITFSSDIETVETPESITFEGETYQVSEIAVVNPGDSIDVAVETDEEGQFELNLYDNEGRILDSKRPASGEEVTFDIEEESGTYVLMVLGPDGDTEAIAPVVAREYDVDEPTVDPENPAPGDDVTVTTTVRELEDSSDVALVIWNGDEKRERSMTADGGDSYSVTLADVEEGEYLLYTVVYGEDTLEDSDQQELVGISQTIDLHVETSDDAGGGDGDSGGGGDTGGDGGTDDDGTDDDEETETPTETPSENATETPTDTPTETPAAGTETETNTAGTEDGSAQATTEPPTTAPPTTTTDDGPITPNATDPGPTQESAPLRGLPLALLALVFVGFFRRMRR